MGLRLFCAPAGALQLGVLGIVVELPVDDKVVGVDGNEGGPLAHHPSQLVIAGVQIALHEQQRRYELFVGPWRGEDDHRQGVTGLVGGALLYTARVAAHVLFAHVIEVSLVQQGPHYFLALAAASNVLEGGEVVE